MYINVMIDYLIFFLYKSIWTEEQEVSDNETNFYLFVDYNYNMYGVPVFICQKSKIMEVIFNII